MVDDVAVVQAQKVARDPQRPQFHFLPAENWLNDPNGLIQWNCRYHLFYQHNPIGPFHGSIHWGHAVSDDLVHWEHLPAALTPTPGGIDAEGCWSGCAVDDDGVPTLLYTAIQPQTVAMATSGDELVTWQKYEGNPLIPGPPAQIDAGDPAHFRDPFVWREGDTWYMLMGARIVGEGGVALLYRSTDLTAWEYRGPLLTGDEGQTDPFWTGNMWECPNLFPVGDGHALIVSFANVLAEKLLYTGYFSGHYEEGRLHPKRQEILEYGGHFYAPQIMKDKQGRWLIRGWLWEGRKLEAVREAGWAGAMSLPRVLLPAPNGTVRMAPAPELEALRGDRWHLEEVAVSPGGSDALDGIRGDALEIQIAFTGGDAERFGVALRRSPGGEEETRVVYDRSTGLLTVDRQRASLDPQAYRWLPDYRQRVSHAPLPLAAGDTLQLQIFLDRSVIEIFAEGSDGRLIVYSSRIYPTRPDSLGLQLFAEDGNVTAGAVDVWQMGDIWSMA